MDLAEIKQIWTMRDLTVSETDSLIAEVERLQGLNDLYVSQNSDNADDNVVLRNQNRKQWEEMQTLTADLSRVSAERDELRGQLDNLKAILQETCNTLHAYSQDNKHAEVTRLIQERDTWKDRYHNKTLRFNAVVLRAKVDMARLRERIDEINTDLSHVQVNHAVALNTLSLIRSAVGSEDVVGAVEKLKETVAGYQRWLQGGVYYTLEEFAQSLAEDKTAVAKAYAKGRESMQEEAAQLMEIQSPHLFVDPDALAEAIRAISITPASKGEVKETP